VKPTSAPDGDIQAEGSEGALAADADRWAAVIIALVGKLTFKPMTFPRLRHDKGGPSARRGERRKPIAE